LVDPDYTLSTDTLLYNVNTEISRFVSPTKIFDGKSSIETRSGYYDLKQGLADFNKRPVIRDSSQTVIADSIIYNKNTGAGMAIGQVDYSDTSQGISMLAGKAEFNNTTKVVKTYERPLMKFLQEGDSLFVAADTLYSAYLGFDSTGIVNPADTFRFFRAYHQVKIFSDSLQGKCDSLYYSSMDSVFRFFKEPVMWAQASQISGDTIYLFTRNKKADRVLVNENAFSVNQSAEGLYNQLRGNNMSGQFINGEIDYLRTKGNSESLYYLQEEDSSYMGMTYSQADAIIMKFIGKEIKRVSWINGVSGTTYPMKQIPADKKELRNFKWLEGIRPKSIEDLLVK
jgi:lipopolysaccharide export system protein LptA